MSSGTGIRDLRLWQEAVALSGDVVRLAVAAARRERRAYTDVLVRAATSLAVAAADGCARYDPAEQRRSLAGARRALVALDTLLAVGRHANILPAPAVADLSARGAALARLIAGLAAYAERQVELAAAPHAR